MAWKFETYADKSGKYRWRLVASNGRLVGWVVRVEGERERGSREREGGHRRLQRWGVGL